MFELKNNENIVYQAREMQLKCLKRKITLNAC